MAVVIVASDNFNRTPNDLIDVGNPAWRNQNFPNQSVIAPRIVSSDGQIATKCSDASRYTRYGTDVYADITLSCDVWVESGTVAEDHAYLFLRGGVVWASQSSFYVFHYRKNTGLGEQYWIQRGVSNASFPFQTSLITLASYTEPAHAAYTRKSMRFEAKGSTLTAYLDDVLVMTTEDGAYATGSFGIGGGGPRTVIDNFAASVTEDDTVPALSSPHLASHFDPSKLLHSPHLVGRF